MRVAFLAGLVSTAVFLPVAAEEKVRTLSPNSPILSETFDDPASLEGWGKMDGAVNGDGPYSVASIDDGALRLQGDTSTRRWLAMTRTAPLGDARWVRISARMKTEEVTPGGMFYPNCNLFFRFDGGPLQITRVLTGTQDWTTTRRRVPVPEGAKEITLGCFLSMPGSAWFDDVTVEAAAPPAWQSARVGHFRYFILPGDGIPESSGEFNNESYRIVTEMFGKGPDPVDYYKYPDLDTKEELTGVRGNAHRSGKVIHSIWPSDRHEIVHVFADTWGDPPALIGEGIAVWISGAWQEKPVKDAARKILEDKKWIPLGEIFRTADFRRHPDLVTYGIAGAFVGHLLETRNEQVLKGLYGGLKNGAPLEQNLAVFQAVLGMSPDEADEKLREWLR